MNDADAKTVPVPCPFCESKETELIALFGMQMMTSQYYCRACRSVFEAVKWTGSEPSENYDEAQKPD